MNPDEIFAKVDSGELSGEDLTNVVNELDVDKQAELRQKFAEATQQTVGEMTATRKEKKRVEDLLAKRQEELDKQKPETPPETPPENPPAQQPPQNESDGFAQQFREEQKGKAIKKFVDDFGLSEGEQEKILAQFEKMDSGKMDADNIYDDLVGVYAFLNRDTLVKADQERKAREAAAEAEAAQAAGGPGGAPNDGNKPPKYSEAAQNLAKQANISEEAAERQLTQGTKRVFQ